MQTVTGEKCSSLFHQQVMDKKEKKAAAATATKQLCTAVPQTTVDTENSSNVINMHH